MKQKSNYNIYHLLSLFLKHDHWHIKMLETMCDKNKFLQLLKYFLPNVIMKQQEIRTTNKIAILSFLDDQ